MIGRFKHKGLGRFHVSGDRRGIDSRHATWLRIVLTSLESAEVAEDMNLPGYRLHRLKGDRDGDWSVWVSGNWRLVFRFENGNAIDIDLVDYH